MKKTERFLVAILALATLLSTVAMAEGPTENPVSADSYGEGVTVTDFDRDFLGYIHAKNERDNYIVSPLSFRAAMILAVEGADASTRTQLLAAMGFSSEEDMTHWYAAVRESIDFFDGWVSRQAQIAEGASRFYPPGEVPEVPEHAYRVLNSVWNNTDRFGAFLPAYIRYIAEHYSATADSLSADRITEAVNHWYDAATSGLIPKISDDLSACAAALVNTVYLKSSWVDEFSKRMTEPEDFTDVDGKVTRRDMMKAKDRYRYYENERTRLISVPLNGGLSFIAVLGDDSDWLADYDAAKYADVDLWLPKLDTESSFGSEVLVQYLVDRGAADAFDANAANFSRMADYPWYISDILHKAMIKTDEEGLEAAALTMVMMNEGAAPEPEEPQYREFHANKPFRYYIVTTQTRTPLVVFAGQEAR